MNPNTTDHNAEYFYDTICEVGDHLVVTVTTDYMGTRVYDIKSGEVGYDPSHKALFIEHLGECLNKGVVMVRKFLNEKTLVSSPQGPVLVPIKELYGLVCREGEVLGLHKDGIRHVAETDATTGAPLSPQYDVEYCSWKA